MFEFIGETLRRLREEQGRTLDQVSELAPVGRSQLSKIERRQQEPTLATIDKVLHALGVGRNEFFDRYSLVENEAVELSRYPREEAERNQRHLVAEGPTVSSASLAALARVGARGGEVQEPQSGVIDLGDRLFVFNVIPKDLKNS